MGLKIREWEKEVSKLGVEKLFRIKESLEVLLDWKVFDKQYGWAGLPLLHKIVLREIKMRGGLEEGYE